MKINTTDPPLRYANRNVLLNSNYRHPYFSQFYPLSPRLGTSASGRRIPLQNNSSQHKKTGARIIAHSRSRPYLLPIQVQAFFTLSTTALKAAGLLRARSASTLRLISMPDLWIRPISLE